MNYVIPSYRFGVSSAALAAAGVVAAPVGGEAVAGETDAMGIDFAYHADLAKQVYISDLTTPANNYNGTAQGKLTYTSPSVKLCRQSDGVWRYANHNLFLQSQTFDATWVTDNSTVTANQDTAPDGTFTADKLTANTANSGLYQGFGAVAGVDYIMSVWLRAITPTTISIFAAANSTVCNVTTSWQRFTCIFTATGAHNLYIGGAGSFSSPEEVFVWGAQLKRYPVNDAGGFLPTTGYLATTTAAVYDLPYEWSAALASQGILIEEQRTNACTRSQEFGTSWNTAGITVTSNTTTAPDGTTTADTLDDGVASSDHNLYQQPSQANVAHTFSVFVKPGTGRYIALSISDATNYTHAVFDLTGLVVTQSGATGGTFTHVASNITDAGNGWYRIVLTGVVPNAANFILILPSNAGTYTPDGFGRHSYLGANRTYYVWGAQLEPGSFPTSPIHTVAAAVTRAVDQVTLAMSSFPWTKTNGTFIFWGDTAASSGTQGEVATAVAGGAFSVSMNTDLFNIVPTTGNSFNNIFPTPPAANTLFKDGCAWASNDGAFVRNAGAATTDSTIDVGGTDATSLSIGRTSANYLNGHIRQVTYLKRRAPNTGAGSIQEKTT